MQMESSLFYNAIYDKGDKVHLVAELYKKNKDFINIPFKVLIGSKYITHSPLTFSLYLKYSNIAKFLLEKGADVNFKTYPDENFPLHIASEMGCEEIVKLLLDNPNVNINNLNKKNETCFNLALKSHHAEIYHLIVNKIKLHKKIPNHNNTNKKFDKNSGLNENGIKQIKDKGGLNQMPIKKGFSISVDNIKLQMKTCDFSKNDNNDISKENDSSVYSLKLMINALNKENSELKDKIKELTTMINSLNEKKELQKQEKKNKFTSSTLSKSLISFSINSSLQTININENEKNQNEKILKNNDENNKEFYHEVYKYQNKFKFDFFSSFINCNSGNSVNMQNKFSLGEVKKCLQQDILDYQKYIKEKNVDNQSLISTLIITLQLTVNQITSDYEVKLYGSRATNLCLFWSDLDVVLINKNTDTKNNDKNFYFLDNLQSDLKKQNWVKNIKYIKTAKVPIIKLITNEKFNHMQIDISIEENNHYGIKCVELVKKYLQEYIILEPLVLAIKTLLKLSGLNDPYVGGLSSYGIILMIVGFLKKKQNENVSINLSNLGEIYYDFLFYYGSNFNNNYINLDENDNNNNNESTNLSPFELMIIDPLNSNNNVGKSTFQFFNIKIMFLIALHALREECFCGCHYHYTIQDKTKNINSSNNLYNNEHNYLQKSFNAVNRLFSTFNNQFSNN